MKSVPGPRCGFPGELLRAAHPEHAAFRRVSGLEGPDLWAATYDQTPNPLVALEERMLRPLLPDPRNRLVLDVGCGTGRWMDKLKRQGARVAVGVDRSFPMLAQAAAKPILRGAVILGDARALPILSGVIDLVMNSFAVGYIDNLSELASELARVTRAGGQVFISDFHPSNYTRGWRRAFRSETEVFEISDLKRPISRIREEFEARGFEQEQCLEPCLGEPEWLLFEQSGKAHLFNSAREGPAIYILQFRRVLGPVG